MKTTRVLTLFMALALLALVLLVLPTSTARADAPVIVRVKVNGATSGTCGDTWENACSLQYALTSTVALPGTELWVAAGTYTPTTGTDRTVTFQLRNDIALYGGFAGGETARTQRNITANVTVLSGDIGMPGDSYSYDNSYHVVTANGVTNTAVLDGFTVTGGNSNGYSAPNDRGGGMYNLNHGSPTLSNTIFSDNSAGYGSGGGMYNDTASNPTLTNVSFSSNSAGTGGGMFNYWSNPTLINVNFGDNSVFWDGGGLYNQDNNPTLTNVTFANNRATGNGGGMYDYYSSPTLTNAAFSSNSANSAGGGMFNEGGSPTLTNVTFSGNWSSSSDGGGMYNYNNSWPTLSNVTFANNSAHDGGGMYNFIGHPTIKNVTFISNTASSNGATMYNTFGSTPTIRNTIIWGSTPGGSQVFNDNALPFSSFSVYDSVVQGGCPTGSTICTNIITDDPHLGALGNYGGSTQTIPLLPGSSAINSGSDATCAADDQRGIPRPQGAHCDIGAYESRGFGLAKGDPSGDNQSTMVTHLFANPLRVSVSSAYGEPVDGGVVTFTAPTSGASAIPVTSTLSIASGMALQTLTANGTVGSYGVSANSSGATTAVTFNLTNIKTDTTIMLSSSENPVLANHPVTLTATVSGASPSGSVAFQDGGTDIQGCTNVSLSGGSAQCTIISPALGTHPITADYSGDANNNPSSGVLTQVVNKANTTTVVTSSENPLSVGHPVTFTVTVSAVAPASTTPTGTVELSETTPAGATVRSTRRTLASQPLVDGVATLSLPSLTAGMHTFLASYGGDAIHNPSTSMTYTQNVSLLYDYLPLLQR